ncbi:MAG: epimerase [Gemmatales bacterium]|nr:MAG: epimerase [Gemmatales bacterium]
MQCVPDGVPDGQVLVNIIRLTMKVLITGGTGTLGRELTIAVAKAGHLVRIGSRRRMAGAVDPQQEWAPIQLVDGSGLTNAVEGIEAVIHAATDVRKAKKVDVAGTRRLIEVCQAAGIKHLIYVSIVGIDEIPLGYYRCKLQAEQIVAQCGVPFSIVRATQFHTLIDQLLTNAARFPLVMPLPTDFQVQSVAPVEVAGRLVRALGEGPSGRVTEFGGPEVMTLGEAVEIWKEIKRKRKRVIHVPMPGKVATGFRTGKNIVRSGEFGCLRWAEWLRQQEAVNIATTI